MKRLSHKIFMLLFFVISMSLSAQNTWQTAQSISHHSITGPITANYVDYWFSFVAQSTFVNLVAGPASATSEAAITTLELYSYNGTSINLLLSLSRDTTIDLTYKNLTIGNTYYVKVSNSNPTESWKLWSTDNIIIVFDDDVCYPPCYNILFNGDFESTDPKTVQPNTTINLLAQHPFRNQVQDIYGVHGTGDTYQNLVCHWKHVIEQWSILSDGMSRIFTPSMFTGYNGSYGARLEASCTFNDGFPIYNNVHIESGKTYNISFRYVVSSALNNGQLKIGFSTAANPNNINNITYLTGSSASFNSVSWTNVSIQFTATQDFESLVLHSHNTAHPGSCWSTYSYIDDIVFTPVQPPQDKPIISGPTTTCNQSGSITYTITNYDPTFVYRYSINGGQIQIAHSNTFTVDLSDLNLPINTIWMENWCENYTEFIVYQCCEPTGYTIFVDEDLTNTKIATIQNNKMVINGIVNVHDNISLSNFDVKFGPMAKLVIDDGYNFTMNGGTLEDACNYPWDGVYIDNSNPSVNSKLKLNGLTSIRGAFNAVVSSNNAEIELTNNYFVNNDIGVKVRNYKPNLCGAVPIGQPPVVVPSYSAIVTGNTIEKIANPFSMFGFFYGIKIDTVYDITIGNENATQNTFKGLNIGIKLNSSGVKVYHNKFENITNSTNPPILSYNNKPQGKIGILAEKLLVPSNITMNYPLPYENQCVASSIIVGKSGTNGGNEFVNCDFGVYSYKHYAEIVNNSFTSQRYNAVWVWDARSKVNNNTIQQMAGIWNTNENLNSAILIEKTFNPSAAYNLQIAEVKANTITNTRIGIQLTHCSSMPNNSTIKTNVENNNITFNSYSPSGYAYSYEYAGIWIAACDRAIVKSNSINNNSGVSIPTNAERSLIGIRVDKTREAWVSHNFNLNYLGVGIWVNGDCHNTQFSCNHFKACNNGIYTYSPSNSSGYAAVISHQGNPSLGRPQDNIFIQMPTSGTRVCGNINELTQYTNYGKAKWFFRNGNNVYFPDAIGGHFNEVLPNPQTSCTNGIIPPPDPNDLGYEDFVDENYGYIVRNEMDYFEYEDEFEYFDDEYLYNVLYNVPEIMNLGEPDDTAYINFYNYLTNRNVRDFIEVQELIDENNINQALMDNGAIVAQNVIEANKQYVNEIYLSSFAENKYFTESQQQTLEAIAMLTPYIGGDAVYTARVMLGINPNTYQLPYRKGHFNDTAIVITSENPVMVYPNPAQSQLTVEFLHALETADVFTLYDITGRKVLEQTLNPGTLKLNINVSGLYNGVYYYSLKNDNKTKGKIIINKN